MGCADLVEINAEKFEGDADVVAEDERVDHVDDVVAVVYILFAQVLEDADLLLRLPVKPLLVADDLQRHVHVVLVVLRLHHLTEAASSQTLCSNHVKVAARTLQRRKGGRQYQPISHSTINTEYAMSSHACITKMKIILAKA